MVFRAINELIERNADKRVQSYFLANSIWEPIAIVAVYLLFFQVVGPKLMKNRKPFDVKKYVIAYNIFQIAINFYFVCICLHGFYSLGAKTFGPCVDIDYTPSERGFREIYIGYLYYRIKILDIMDTLFFLLKKNYRQISFLHLYHHAAMIIFTWYAFKYYSGGHSGWIAILNSIVHVFMYSYYLASAVNPELKNHVVKKYMTQMQLVQFVLIILIYTRALFTSCNFPKFLSLFAIGQAMFFIRLFSDFYYKTYWKPKKVE